MQRDGERLGQRAVRVAHVVREVAQHSGGHGHRFRVAARTTDPGAMVDALLLAQVGTAGPAGVALPAGEDGEHRDPVAESPAGDAGTQAGHDTGELVPEHVPCLDQAGRQHMQVRAADAAAGNVDEHLRDRRFWSLELDYAHVPAAADHGRLHWSARAGAQHRDRPDESITVRIRLFSAWVYAIGRRAAARLIASVPPGIVFAQEPSAGSSARGYSPGRASRSIQARATECRGPVSSR